MISQWHTEQNRLRTALRSLRDIIKNTIFLMTSSDSNEFFVMLNYLFQLYFFVLFVYFIFMYFFNFSVASPSLTCQDGLSKEYTSEEREVAAQLIGLNNTNYRNEADFYNYSSEENLDDETTLSAISDSFSYDELDEYSEHGDTTISATESLDLSSESIETSQNAEAVEENLNEDEELKHLRDTISNLNVRLKNQYYEKSKFKKEANNLNEQIEEINKTFKKIFGKDQIESMGRKNMRGKPWSQETIQKALQILFTCHTTGYDHLLKAEYPLPPLRTLRSRLEKMNFSPGIIDDVFQFLPSKVKEMKETDKFCALTMDEMSIKPGYQFDMSTQEYQGDVTLPDENGLATHGLVFMLAGLATRWKQVVAYHFTGKSYKGPGVKKIIDKILDKATKAGLKVISITADMGTNNQAVFSEYNISKNENKIKHPAIPNFHLYFFWDPPHVIKCLRNCLVNGHIIILPPSIVQDNNLSSNIVDIEYVRMLFEAEKHYDWKMCPNLSEALFNPNQWEAMNVAMAAQLIASHATSLGLYRAILSQEKRFQLIDKEAEATAWFIAHLDKWFDAMNSRTMVTALSKKKIEKYNEKMDLFKLSITLFKELKVYEKHGLSCTTKTNKRLKSSDLQMGKINQNPDPWKPWQTSIIVTSNSTIEMSEYLLTNGGFEFFLTSRITQDCLENLFSTVRKGNPNPNCLEFKKNLKLIAASQYLGTPANGNYENDGGKYLLNFVNDRPRTKKSNKPDLLENAAEVPIEFSWEKMFGEIESEAFYDFCGYVCFKVIKALKRCKCFPVPEFCVKKLTSNESEVKESTFTSSKEFVRDKKSLTYVSSDVFNILKKCEYTFIANKKNLFTHGQLYDGLKTLMMESTHLLGCDRHALNKLLCSTYASTRLNIQMKQIKKNSKPQKVHGIRYRVLAPEITGQNNENVGQE